MLISIKKYAELSGVSYQAIYLRKNSKYNKIEFITAENGGLYIDDEKYPPVKIQRGRRKLQDIL